MRPVPRVVEEKQVGDAQQGEEDEGGPHRLPEVGPLRGGGGVVLEEGPGAAVTAAGVTAAAAAAAHATRGAAARAHGPRHHDAHNVNQEEEVHLCAKNQQKVT